ncbi:MAG: hypothetical protein MUF54_06190, partial [Polyangiaceae bacterium]|nr:hypothetical protein [Polyangiaceae bacterium]
MPGHEMSKEEVIDRRKALADCLRRAGAVETQRDTKPEPQTLGLWFLPRPSGAAHPVHSLPILGRIAREPALVERFHEAPTAQEIRECFLKRHAMHEELLRADSGATLPMIWILAGARPS